MERLGDLFFTQAGYHFLGSETTSFVIRKKLLETVDESITLPTKPMRFANNGVPFEWNQQYQFNDLAFRLPVILLVSS